MKRTALLIACTFLLYDVQDASAANRFSVGGARNRTSGTVRVEVNGGAGRRPQFEIGGRNRRFNQNSGFEGVGINVRDPGFEDVGVNVRDPGFNRDGEFNSDGQFRRVRNRRAAANSFPVAVAPGGYGYGYGGYGGYFGDGGFTNLYNQGFIPVPPYYSLHPPVYYSVPVPRTYGYSPFAYPGGVPTPEVTITEPEIIDNPHVEPEEAPAPAQETSAKTASAPVVISNPFVEQAGVVLTAQHVD